MLSFLAQAVTEPPPDPAVWNWIVGALGALALYERLSRIFGKAPPDKREISGSIDTKKASVPADKSEVEDELEQVEDELEKINGSIGTLSTKLDDKVEALMKAGEARAEKITEHINREINAIRQDVQNRIQLIQDKIAAAIAKDARHDEAIDTLKVNQHSHSNQIAQIHQKLPKSRLP